MRPRTLVAIPLLLLACEKPARIELQPTTLRFGLRGQSAKIHASPLRGDGKPIPDHVCRWSSSNEQVATASGPHNEATVTAVGPGSASVRCTMGDVVAEAPVTVRVVARVAVKPDRIELKMLDDPAPAALAVQAFDDVGQPVLGRVAYTRCVDEAVCRGDARGQLWGVGSGTSTAVVEVEGARAEVPVHVVDARTAAGRPKRVTGNPMEEIERAVKQRDAEAARAKAKAKP